MDGERIKRGNRKPIIYVELNKLDLDLVPHFFVMNKLFVYGLRVDLDLFNNFYSFATF